VGHPWAPPAVVGELDDVVGVGGLLGSHDALKERLRQLLPVHNQPPLEEPMAAVLAGDTVRGRGQCGTRSSGVGSMGTWGHGHGEGISGGRGHEGGIKGGHWEMAMVGGVSEGCGDVAMGG